MSKNINVLHLARWYPNRYDPMPGLFIQRHAEAASRFCTTGVVYSHVVTKEKVNGYELDFSVSNGVPTAKVYYNNPNVLIPGFSQAITAFRFFRANYLGIEKIKSEIGDIDLFHVHILTRLGIIALIYKWFRGIPYVVSEHWSRYLPLTDTFRGTLRKWLTKVVVKNASAVTTVTHNLAVAMQNHGLENKHYTVLPNVVNDVFFKTGTANNSKDYKKRFIHVSCFEDKSKNISGLLQVIGSLAEKRKDFLFTLVGDGMDFELLKQRASENGLGPDLVKFTGLLENEALALEMAGADLMVVFSNYENFPVVINESFVLGIPVVATRVGGIPEFVNDSNGRLIEAGDESALEHILTKFLDNEIIFDNKAIRLNSKSIYSIETVGKELFEIYSSAISETEPH